MYGMTGVRCYNRRSMLKEIYNESQGMAEVRDAVPFSVLILGQKLLKFLYDCV